MEIDALRAFISSRWFYWKTPVLFGVGLCVLQILVALVRFGSMNSWSPANLLFALPAILSGLILLFLGGLLVGLLVQRFLRGVAGPWRTVLLVAVAVATPFAVLFSLVGGLLGPPYGAPGCARSVSAAGRNPDVDPAMQPAFPTSAQTGGVIGRRTVAKRKHQDSPEGRHCQKKRA